MFLIDCQKLLSSINYFKIFSTAQLCWVNQIMENFHIIANVWFSHWQAVNSSYIVDPVDILNKKWVYILWFLGAKGIDISRVGLHQTSGLSSTDSGFCKKKWVRLVMLFHGNLKTRKTSLKWNLDKDRFIMLYLGYNCTMEIPEVTHSSEDWTNAIKKCQKKTKTDMNLRKVLR